jgi:hypothetical protein
MTSDDESKPQPAADQAVAHFRADGADLIVSARDFIGGVLPAGIDSSGPPSLSRQEASLRRWAHDVGLLLKVDDLPEEVMRGGMEHDLYRAEDRIIKVTRNGVFGLSPGIDLALVASDRDGRRFHLWEATPLQYLERLHLQNMLVPGLNSLEGVIDQPDDLAIVISQPRFEIIPVTEEEIIAWFALQGFAKVTASGYYRAEDNLGVFDAHDKNVVRFENDLIPFDVIPVRPDGGFLGFIEDTLGAGHEVREVRTVNRGT